MGGFKLTEKKEVTDHKSTYCLVWQICFNVKMTKMKKNIIIQFIKKNIGFGTHYRQHFFYIYFYFNFNIKLFNTSYKKQDIKVLHSYLFERILFSYFNSHFFP